MQLLDTPGGFIPVKLDCPELALLHIRRDIGDPCGDSVEFPKGMQKVPLTVSRTVLQCMQKQSSESAH